VLGGCRAARSGAAAYRLDDFFRERPDEPRDDERREDEPADLDRPREPLVERRPADRPLDPLPEERREDDRPDDDRLEDDFEEVPLCDRRPPFRPPLRDGSLFVDLCPEPPLRPPPVSLFTVAHARRSASFSPTPRLSYPSSMWCAILFCLDVYLDLSPRGITVSRVAGTNATRARTPAVTAPR
jgi:hypothetical protein